MTKQSESTAYEAGQLVVVEERDGFWTVEAHEHGWVTVKQDDETLKVRAKQLDLVPDAEEEDEDDSGKRMASTLDRYKPEYVPTVTHSGTKSLNNGDRVAKLLAGLEPGHVARIADEVKGEPLGTHEAKYAHLNPGQVRMNSGNRIRAHAKQGEAEMNDVLAAAAKHGVVEQGEAQAEAA